MSHDDSHFRSLDVSEMFCPRCRVARPVRQHLLLVLPTGNKYEYRCAHCGESVGEKADNDASNFRMILDSTDG